MRLRDEHFSDKHMFDVVLCVYKQWHNPTGIMLLLLRSASCTVNCIICVHFDRSALLYK